MRVVEAPALNRGLRQHPDHLAGRARAEAPVFAHFAGDLERVVPIAGPEMVADEMAEKQQLPCAVASPARQLDPLDIDLRRLVPPVSRSHLVGEVEVAAHGRAGEIVLQRDLEGVLECCERFLEPAAGVQQQALRVEGLRQDGRQPQRLRDLQRPLHGGRAASLSPTNNRTRPSWRRGSRDPRPARRRRGRRTSAASAPRLGRCARRSRARPMPGLHARSGVGAALRLEERDRALEELDRLCVFVRCLRRLTGLLVEPAFLLGAPRRAPPPARSTGVPRRSERRRGPRRASVGAVASPST